MGLNIQYLGIKPRMYSNYRALIYFEQTMATNFRQESYNMALL